MKKIYANKGRLVSKEKTEIWFWDYSASASEGGEKVRRLYPQKYTAITYREQ